MGLSILLVGCGAIARYVADATGDEAGIAARWALVRPGRAAAAEKALGAGFRAVDDLDRVEGRIDLAIECAGHAAVAEHGPALLERGTDLAVLSVGALAEPSTVAALERAARRGGAAVDILAGAVGGLDALAAARVGGIERVVYTGRKPPAAWRGTPAEERLDLDGLDGPAVHFEGSAREAARRYPKNANVVATVALAGIGFDATQARLIADPAAERNCHEIVAEGGFGRISISLEAKPLSGNARTSALAAMSAVRALRRRLDRVRL